MTDERDKESAAGGDEAAEGPSPRWPVTPAAGAAPAPLVPADRDKVPMKAVILVDPTKEPFTEASRARYHAWALAQAAWEKDKRGPPPPKPDLGFRILRVAAKRREDAEDYADRPSTVPSDEATYLNRVRLAATPVPETVEAETIRVVEEEARRREAEAQRGTHTMPRLNRLVREVAPELTQLAAMAPINDLEVDPASRTLGGKTARFSAKIEKFAALRREVIEDIGGGGERTPRVHEPEAARQARKEDRPSDPTPLPFRIELANSPAEDAQVERQRAVTPLPLGAASATSAPQEGTSHEEAEPQSDPTPLPHLIESAWLAAREERPVGHLADASRPAPASAGASRASGRGFVREEAPAPSSIPSAVSHTKEPPALVAALHRRWVVMGIALGAAASLAAIGIATVLRPEAVPAEAGAVAVAPSVATPSDTAIAAGTALGAAASPSTSAISEGTAPSAISEALAPIAEPKAPPAASAIAVVPRATKATAMERPASVPIAPHPIASAPTALAPTALAPVPAAAIASAAAAPLAPASASAAPSPSVSSGSPPGIFVIRPKKDR